MTQYNHFFKFLIIVAGGLLVFILVSGGYYPIASVNGEFISSRQFKKDYRAISLYYVNTLKTYSDTLKVNNINLDLKPLDLQLSTINSLVENILIDKEVSQEVGSVLNSLISDKISQFENDVEFQKAANALYGMNFVDFKDEVLIPQVKRDILNGRLFLKGQKIESWLDEAKKNSKVNIFSGRFYWDGSQVKAKE